jgi:HSP20 family protein
MTLIRWRPRRDLMPFPAFPEFGDLWDNFLDWPRIGGEIETYRWTPRVNVEENDGIFELTAEVPGIDKKDINVEVKDHVLTIRGEKKLEEEKKENNYRVCERCYGEFVRTFTLPDNVDADKIEAQYENGVLKLIIPKKEEAKPKEIKVAVK